MGDIGVKPSEYKAVFAADPGILSVSRDQDNYLYISELRHH